MTMTTAAMTTTTNGDLDTSVVEQFQRDGYVKIEGVLTRGEADDLKGVLLRELGAYRRGERDCTPGYQAWETSALNISNLWKVLGELAGLSPHARLARVAANLVRADAIRLYHDSLIYKRAGLPHGPWHQDQYYSLVDDVITGWMPLVPIDNGDGALIYARGSHHDGLVDVAGMSQAAIEAHLHARGYTLYRIAMQPGDAVFHTGTVFHRSDSTWTQDRPAFSSFLFREGARLRDLPFGRALDTELEFFPGCTLGTVADSPLNPRLFARGSSSTAGS